MFDVDERTRVEKWVELDKSELCDCQIYHTRIGELKWHHQPKARLQPTSRPLMLLMLSFLKRSRDNESLRRTNVRSGGAAMGRHASSNFRDSRRIVFESREIVSRSEASG